MRAPVQWLIGTSPRPGALQLAMFVHQPYGSFYLTGSEGKFALPVPRGQVQTPISMVNPDPVVSRALPLDVLITASREPAAIMRECARISGLPEMPARRTSGCQQSPRTRERPDRF